MPTMPSKPQITTGPRICVICGDNFQAKTGGPGRPPAFCSTKCRSLARVTRNRVCTVCSAAWSLDDHPESTGAYFCSDECRKKRYPCPVCKDAGIQRLTEHAYCSAEHFRAEHPAPYHCLTCGNGFDVKDERLNLDSPPKYCSSTCYESRRNAADGPVAPAEATAYALALHAWHSATQPFPPTRPNGLPWTKVRTAQIPPLEEQALQVQNVVRFWRWHLQHLAMPPEVLNGYLAYAAVTGFGEEDLRGIHHTLNIWPYLREDWPDTYSPGVVNSHLSQYMTAVRSKRYSSRYDTEDIHAMVQRAVNMLSGPEIDPKDARWAAKWLQPVPGVGHSMLYSAVVRWRQSLEPPVTNTWLHLDAPLPQQIINMHSEYSRMFIKKMYPEYIGKKHQPPPWWKDRNIGAELQAAEKGPTRTEEAIEAVLRGELTYRAKGKSK